MGTQWLNVIPKQLMSLAPSSYHSAIYAVIHERNHWSMHNYRLARAASMHHDDKGHIIGH